MKQPKRPTREQKIIIYNNKLEPTNWMVIKEDENYLYIISKTGKMKKKINKFVKVRGRGEKYEQK